MDRRQATNEEVSRFLKQSACSFRRYPHLLKDHHQLLPHYDYFAAEGASPKVIKAIDTVERFDSNRRQFFDKWEKEFLLWLCKQHDKRLLASTLGQAYKHCHFKAERHQLIKRLHELKAGRSLSSEEVGATLITALALSDAAQQHLILHEAKQRWLVSEEQSPPELPA